jgi:1,2-phenylacetyl-CoA epoxidase catalytic subunit
METFGKLKPHGLGAATWRLAWSHLVLHGHMALVLQHGGWPWCCNMEPHLANSSHMEAGMVLVLQHGWLYLETFGKLKPHGHSQGQAEAWWDPVTFMPV